MLIAAFNGVKQQQATLCSPETACPVDHLTNPGACFRLSFFGRQSLVPDRRSASPLPKLESFKEIAIC
jgi:hypothetical protein